MTQSGYPGSAAMTGSPNMPMHFYATPPEQNYLLSPTGEFACQQWPEWDNPTAEGMYAPDNSAAPVDSMPWDVEGQDHQPFDLTGTSSNFTTAGWASNGWAAYQQQHFPPQSAIFSPTTQWPTPACSPPAMAMVRPPPSESQYQYETETRATQPTTKTTKKTADRRTSSASQQPPKKVRVFAGGKPSPASTASYDDDDEGEESDAPPCLAGSDRKKTYRVKNRAAAKRCREKTKQYEIDLAAKEQQVTQERMYLDACVTALKNEVLTLKSQILQHGDCDCEMIQGYIARAASGVSHGAPLRRPPDQAHPMA